METEFHGRESEAGELTAKWGRICILMYSFVCRKPEASIFSRQVEQPPWDTELRMVAACLEGNAGMRY